MTGKRIAHYEITAKLGEGGMGEVYRATDTKLGREVAIKVIPEAVARDADRMARFAREARVLASLNHPNIATIYGIEESALVMELVEGPTLAERMAPGPIPVEEALPVARQIAEALEYAHERGIIHRDLKPANVKLAAEGHVKVLDFGLAKAQESAESRAEDASTLAISATRPGTILGTSAYMSPEQAGGKPADKRADIWSFGVVLWEMLTGHRLFETGTVTQTLAEVMRGPIDFDRLPHETPAAIRTLLRRCLDRDEKNRLRDIGEARIAIEAALACETLHTESAAEHGGARRQWLAWSVAAMATVGLSTIAYLHFRERPSAPASSVRFDIPPPENATVMYLRVSPDGRKLSFIAKGRLWVHSLESGESRDLSAAPENTTCWSPDSRFIAYPLQGKLMTIEAAGGPPQAVLDLPGAWSGCAWSQTDVIVFAEMRVGLFRVSASGGAPVQITSIDPARQEIVHYGTSFLPDGRHFFYTRLSTHESKSGIYLGSVDAKPEQQSTRSLVVSNWAPEYAPSAEPGTGYLLFMRQGTLMAQPFDDGRLELKGQAAMVVERVSDNSGGTGGWGSFSVSANDVLAFQRGAASDRQLTWYDRAGKVVGTAREKGDYRDLALSPEGTRLAVSKRNGPASNIWLLDLSRDGASTRFTFGSGVDESPVWSPDGSRIVFRSNRSGPFDLYQKPATGLKGEQVLLKSGEDKRATSWSRDGRFLLYEATHARTKDDVWVLRLEGDMKTIPFMSTDFNENQAHFSPDGRWVAYVSDESGHPEVYVRAFSLNSAGTGGKWQISSGFGLAPRWRGDGGELYYRSREGWLMAVEITSKPAFRSGKPRPTIPLPPGPQWPFPMDFWDCTADGRLFFGAAVEGGPEPYTVVLNWQAAFRAQK
jgi:serine/threonine protein kinase/Tol biopolymer transport system component